MANRPQLTDRFGRPLKRSELKREVAAATYGGVRSPLSGSPGDGLDPVRLAEILKAADQGDPVQYLELAEVIEERDPHYLGVIGTRRRSISQLDITVKAASEDPIDVAKADMVREWLDRDELVEELFDILDCIPKGYSFTEIIWDTSEGQWMPSLEYRDPRWFDFDPIDLKTPMLIGEGGQREPLPAFKFIDARIKAKSGLPIRSGLARVAAWGWLFKAYTQKDWAIFTQTYGQPLRVGKWGPGASEADKDTLFDAVANIAGDCAAIIPESMRIDFVETSNVGASSDLYKDRADWLDMQISKAVLGQTATTDSVTGGLGSGKEHRQVQEDIERSDSKALSAIINRDLIRPWCDLEYGPSKAYPRLIIGRPEQEDLEAESKIFETLVNNGVRIKSSQVYSKFGWEEPGEGDAVIGETAPTPPPTGTATEGNGPASIIKRFLGGIKRSNDVQPSTTALNAEQAPEAVSDASAIVEDLADQLGKQMTPQMAALLEQVEAMLSASSSLEEFHEMLVTGFDPDSSAAMASIFEKAMLAGNAGGRATVEDENV